MEELSELVLKYNEALKPLLVWFTQHSGDPMFDTGDGEELLRMAKDVANISAMFGMKVLLMRAQDVILDMKASMCEEEGG